MTWNRPPPARNNRNCMSGGLLIPEIRMANFRGGRPGVCVDNSVSPGHAVVMTVTAGDIISGGWRITPGFAASTPSSESRNFYAVYPGEAFGAPERGVIAAMARAHPELPDQSTGARDSAQLVVHSLAEGYFGAQRTFSGRRAAGLALSSVNRWLFGQAQVDAPSHLTPVSLTALIFYNSQIGIAQVGACQIYRYRNQILVPLMRDHTRMMQDGRKAPTRAIGLDLELSVDYIEDDTEAGDRFILISGPDGRNPDAVYALLSDQLAQATGPEDCARMIGAALHDKSPEDKPEDETVMVLDVLEAPAPDAAAHGHDLSHLPLRPPPREGAVWDGFVIGKTLYRGRYTILKAAYDTVAKREVALKIPQPTMLQDEVFAAGFMREAWIGTTVRGSSVARYIDLPAERRSSLYLVMPLYKGETLEARLHRGPLMSLPDGIGYALKLCEAVQDLAAIQIVHRDIKPDNIMLLPHNEIRLLDLGLAYLPGIDRQDSVKPGGTLRYMAPELLQGVPANARTEVYALGVTIYRMFSGGAYPFGQREAVPLSRLRPDLPGWLGVCLGRALESRPDARFADAGAFAAALQAGLVSGAEPLARPRFKIKLTPLQLWRLAAIIFGIGFFWLLARGFQ